MPLICQISILFSNIYLNKFTKDKSLEALFMFLLIPKQARDHTTLIIQLHL